MRARGQWSYKQFTIEVFWCVYLNFYNTFVGLMYLTAFFFLPNIRSVSFILLHRENHELVVCDWCLEIIVGFQLAKRLRHSSETVIQIELLKGDKGKGIYGSFYDVHCVSQPDQLAADRVLWRGLILGAMYHSGACYWWWWWYCVWNICLALCFDIRQWV